MFSSIFLWCLPDLTFAESQCVPGPTIPENVNKDPSWVEGIEIWLEMETVCQNDYVEVGLNSGFGCPPYYWSLSKTGFHFDHIGGSQQAITFTDEEVLQIWADGTATGIASIQVADDCNNPATAQLTECVSACCGNPPLLQYDMTSSGIQMGRSATKTLYIQGGCPPFTWTLDQTNGNGFSVVNSQTSIRENTLTTNGSACGSVKMLIEDACGNETAGGVRCSVGTYARFLSFTIEVTGEADTIEYSSGYYYAEKDIGSHFQEQHFTCVTYGVPCYDPGWPHFWEECATYQLYRFPQACEQGISPAPMCECEVWNGARRCCGNVYAVFYEYVCN
jgi:hypothetical protein